MPVVAKGVILLRTRVCYTPSRPVYALLSAGAGALYVFGGSRSLQSVGERGVDPPADDVDSDTR